MHTKPGVGNDQPPMTNVAAPIQQKNGGLLALKRRYKCRLNLFNLQQIHFNLLIRPHARQACGVQSLPSLGSVLRGLLEKTQIA